MRQLRNAYILAKIKGYRAGIRHARHGARLALCAALDTASAWCLLQRARLLRRP